MRRPSRRAAFLLALLLVPLGAGCRRPPSSPETGERRPASRGKPPSGSASSGFRALYRGRVTDAGTSRGFRLALAVDLPSRFRIELFGPIGGARLVLVSDGRGLHGAVPAARLCAESEGVADALDRLVGLPVGSDDLLRILLGRFETQGVGEPETVLDLPAVAQGSVRLRLHPGPEGQVATATVEVRDAAAYSSVCQIAYAAFDDGPAGRIPSDLRLTRGERGVVLELRGVEPDAPGPEVFVLPCPAGFRPVPWDALAASEPALLGGAG